jgi:predicted metalloprotease
MPHPLRHRLLPVVLVLSTVWLTGCATVVIGRPEARQSAPHTSGSSATVVGATGNAVDRMATDALADLEAYWSDVFPDVFGRQFVPLQGGYFSVDPGDVDPAQYPQGVGCGSDPREVENNAFYCASPDAPNADSISYDRAFLGELGEGYGAFLPALVMAHEFGHAVQARVGTPATSIATETQADCLAGSWTRWVAEGEAPRSQLREPELDDLLRGYFLLRDPVGTGTAAQSAHGSYFDRVSAFQDGFDDGPEACRDDFGRDRIFTQGEFQTDEDFATKGNADHGSSSARSSRPCPACGTRRSARSSGSRSPPQPSSPSGATHRTARETRTSTSSSAPGSSWSPTTSRISPSPPTRTSVTSPW